MQCWPESGRAASHIVVALQPSCSMPPITPQLSWLMLWAILLGCDDFHSKQELDSGRHHRRPSVAHMADVSARLAAVAEQMDVGWRGEVGALGDTSGALGRISHAGMVAASHVAHRLCFSLRGGGVVGPP